jgi:dipeptidase D
MISMGDKKLSALEPKIVWSIFEEITRIPRCSGKEQKVQAWLKDWAQKNRIQFKKDDVGNILLTGEASTGCEGYPSLVFQSHQDMVCEKDEANSHNFDVDPIPVKVEKDVVVPAGRQSLSEVFAQIPSPHLAEWPWQRRQQPRQIPPIGVD